MARCDKILIALNEEAAHYWALLTAMGTTLDTATLRAQLRQCRRRVWALVHDAKRKFIPLLKHKKISKQDCGDLERMYRVLSACLEFITDQFYITFLLCCDFPLISGTTVFIQTGISETSIPPPPPLPKCILADLSTGWHEHSSNNDRSSLHGASSDLQYLQKEVFELHDVVYDMNQTIAIQPWDVEPHMDITDPFPSAAASSVTEHGNGAKEPREHSMLDVASTDTDNDDQRRIRCVSITVLTIIVIVVGGIVGILMGVLD